MNFKVIREQTHWGFNEAYLGYGYITLCSGRNMAALTDDAIIAAVKKDCNCLQAVKFVKEDDSVAEYIAIFVDSNGYKAIPVYTGEEAHTHLPRNI